jgi:hypothetical protein
MVVMFRLVLISVPIVAICIQTKAKNRYLLALIIIKNRIAKMVGILCLDRVIQLMILIQIKSDFSHLRRLKAAIGLPFLIVSILDNCRFDEYFIIFSDFLCKITT